MGYFAPRDVETTVKCPSCSEKLHIVRRCKEVLMHCPSCGKTYPFRDFVNKADKVMEEFMENVYIDRI